MIRLTLLIYTIPYKWQRLPLISFLVNYLFWTSSIIITNCGGSSMTIGATCYNIPQVETRRNWLFPLTIATCSHFGRNSAMINLLVDIAVMRLCRTVFGVQPWFQIMLIFLRWHPTQILGSPWRSKRGILKETSNRGSVMLRSIKSEWSINH